MDKNEIKDFKDTLNTLIDLTTSGVLSNAIGTFDEIKDIDLREKIAKDFITKVLVRATQQSKIYFDNLRKWQDLQEEQI